MPIAALELTTALLVIDLQDGLVDLPTIEAVRDIAIRAGELAEAFRENGLPVVLINVVGGGSTEFLPELGRRDRRSWMPTRKAFGSPSPATPPQTEPAKRTKTA